VCARCWVLRDQKQAGRLFEGGVVDLELLGLVLSGIANAAGGVGYRPYFENYTVDASILD
jgi:hypothetical protein